MIKYITKDSDWEEPPYFRICPEMKIIYKGKKDKGFWWHTPGVMDGGIIVHGKMEEDKFYHITLLKDNFWGEEHLDEIKFKPEINKEYSVYMNKDYPNKIYVGANYERVTYKTPQEILGEFEKDIEVKNAESKKTAFESLVPSQMMRLVRLANPQCVRDKIFSEFPIEAQNEKE